MAEKKCTIQQHISREKHINTLKLMKIKNEKPQQLLNDELSNNINSFNKELYRAKLSANIPLNKLKNTLFCNFLEKYKYEKNVRRIYFKNKLCG